MAGAIDVDRALVLRRKRLAEALRRVRFDRGRCINFLGLRRLACRRNVRIAGETDSRMTLASLSMRRIATARAKVMTAAQTATAPASAYKTPRPVGSRSRLA